MSAEPSVAPGQQHCAQCGFTYAVERFEEAPAAVIDIGARAATFLRNAAAEPTLAGLLGVRPEPEVWSVLEYAGHLRDVQIALRERLFLGLFEDRPVMPSTHRELRVVADRYGEDDPLVIAGELEVLSKLLARTLSRVDRGALERPLVFNSAERTIAWLAQQAIHEGEHHMVDMADVAASVGALRS